MTERRAVETAYASAAAVVVVQRGQLRNLRALHQTGMQGFPSFALRAGAGEAADTRANAGFETACAGTSDAADVAAAAVGGAAVADGEAVVVGVGAGAVVHGTGRDAVV